MEPQVPDLDNFTQEVQDHEEINGDPPLLTRSSTNDDGAESLPCIPMATVEDEIIEEGDAQPPSSLEGQAKALSEDANLRCIWDETMKDYSVAGKPHRRVAVLMISWHETLDDLETMEEVNALEDVWRSLFNYEVVKKELVRGKRPGIQLIKHLADFVHEYEGESSLLIVYYAGHGIPGKPGELHLAGKRQPNKKHSIENAVAWHESEHIIRDAEADVLLIFDCCYAGNLLSRDVRSYYQTRSYETLAACGRREVTNPPGEESFTSALIWALKELVRERQRFTITELQTRIMNGAPNFPKGQFVPLLERHDPCDQRLILAPLPSGMEVESPVSTSSNHAVDLRQNFLDLRFFFPKRPDEEEIRNLALRLRRDMMDNNIGARSIVWLALKNKDLIRNAAEKWKSYTRNKTPFQAARVNGEGPSGSVLCSPTPQRSHSSEYGISEGHPDSQCAVERTNSSDDDLTTIPTNNSVKNTNLTRAEAGTRSSQNTLRYSMMNAMRRLYPVLRMALVFSLGAGAWYTLPFPRRYSPRRWAG